MILFGSRGGSNHKNAPYHADIKANVILSESEQEKPIKARRMNVLTLKEDSQQKKKASQQTKEDSSLIAEDSFLTEYEEHNGSCVPSEEECPDE